MQITGWMCVDIVKVKLFLHTLLQLHLLFANWLVLRDKGICSPKYLALR